MYASAYAASYALERLRQEHAPGVCALLEQVFPDHLMVRLGSAALREFVRAYATVEDGLGFVCTHEREVVAFVIGAKNARRFRAEWICRRWAPLLWHASRGLATNPHSLGRTIRNLLPYLSPLRSSSRGEAEVAGGELTPPGTLILLAVDQAHRRRGLADRLTDAFLGELARRSISYARLAVAAANEPALSFHLSRGWQLKESYRTPDGDLVYQLIYHLASVAASCRA